MNSGERVDRNAVEVPCTIDIALTPEQLHAHVVLEGIEVQPGDEVLVHESPAGVAAGQHIVCYRRATVVRASWPRRVWTRFCAHFQLTHLFEVSFSDRRLNRTAPSENLCAPGVDGSRPVANGRLEKMSFGARAGSYLTHP
jgi:hypothetical protein